jgi:hypothetical protein
MVSAQISLEDDGTLIEEANAKSNEEQCPLLLVCQRYFHPTKTVPEKCLDRFKAQDECDLLKIRGER